MWYTAKISAYDVLNTITVAARMDLKDDEGQSLPDVMTYRTSFQGKGELDPREWLKDALIALLEVL